MQKAIDVAQSAFDRSEVPVGCVIIDCNSHEVLAVAHNSTLASASGFSHAEMIALQQATYHNNDWRLQNAYLFVTMEPCLMCLGAILQHRIKKVFVSTLNEKFGCFSRYHLNLQNLNSIKFEFNILSLQSQKMLNDFFLTLRNHKKNKIVE